MNDLSCGIRIWAHVSFVLSQSTRFTDRWTYSFLVARPRCMQCMQRGKNVTVVFMSMALNIECVHRSVMNFC